MPEPAPPRFVSAADDAPVVRYLQQLLEQAVDLKASDIHFEPYEHHYRVRMRIDGVLRVITSAPMALKDTLGSRIKVLSRLDIAEKRLPQDGRMKLTTEAGRLLDLRVSTLPTLFGEKLVLRILDGHQQNLDLSTLGYEQEDLDRLRQAIARTEGLVLMTGPTGSGKTQSLYACLQQLNQNEVNIATVEDPCEIALPGINQVNVHDKPGLSFAVALRAFLRQDPDILMVGEIRDLETAEIAIQAAQTGHLVLSTLHTNDAPAALTRLRNMGVAPYNIAASVSLVTAQRLVRRLCPHCRVPMQINEVQLAAAGWQGESTETLPDQIYRAQPQGCPQCHKGYSGRTGIFQVMPISARMQQLVLSQDGQLELATQAQKEGVHSLREAGLHKILQGLTSLEEVLAATHEGAR
jgi:type IV pilus assembly protein PilB